MSSAQTIMCKMIHAQSVMTPVRSRFCILHISGFALQVQQSKASIPVQLGWCLFMAQAIWTHKLLLYSFH